MTLDELRNADLFDSRDVIARIEELEAFEPEDSDTDADFTIGDREELETLRDFASEGEGFEDWEYGAGFIRDSYFEQYAQELAEEIGAIPENNAWPTYCIDWEWAARELRMDYSSIELDGVTFWARS